MVVPQLQVCSFRNFPLPMVRMMAICHFPLSPWSAALVIGEDSATADRNASASDHVNYVVERKYNYSDVVGPTAMPYLNGLANQ